MISVFGIELARIILHFAGNAIETLEFADGTKVNLRTLGFPINGTSGDDTLIGNPGADSIDGGAGNDILFGDGGNDRLLGQFGNDTLFGETGDDLLDGFEGNDVLDGGVGADSMSGGPGDDSYTVENTADSVFELGDDGNDTVSAWINWALAEHVENLSLKGSRSIDGTGNALANILTGNAGNNVLNGGLGADTLLGGAGNDTYVVDAAGDKVFETTTATSTVDAGGTDTVQSAVGFSLDASAGVRFVENLTLTGTASIDGTGNALANILTGNAGNNVLNGGLGADTLLGGAGNDTFVFNTTLSAANVDTIQDFRVSDDTILLDKAMFTGLAVGTLTAAALASNASGVAADQTDRIVYDSGTGKLFFDSDGTGATERVHFATLSTGLLLAAGDFFVV